MYAVSNDYITAKNRSPQVHSFKLSGTVGSVPFTESNILMGSLSISNKCSSGKNILVGSATIGELKATFIGIDIAENADITLSEGLLVGENTYEYVPMGIYRISEAKISRSGVEVTAYDRMSFFDKAINIDTTYGYPYDIARLACKNCGVSLGMTNAEMLALPNGDEQLNLYTENDLQTWRDLIFWLAQAMACFATIDRAGNLVFRPFRQVADDTINNHRRYSGATFSRFISRYSGISVANMIDGTTNYYGQAQDNYLTYNLGENPFLQYDNETKRDRICNNVLDGISNIAYTPFKAETNVGAIYDLGDIIQHEDGLAEDADASISCVMRIVWKYNGGTMAEGVGENPSLATAKSKTDKAIQGLLGKIGTEEVQFYTFTNAEDIAISDGERERIISIEFTSNQPTTVIFNAEILLTAETTVSGINYNDLICTVKYRWNGADYDEDYVPVEIYTDGSHILTLNRSVEIPSAKVSQIEVFLVASGGSIAIAAGNIRSMVYGQGLLATDKWDGKTEIEQEIGLWSVGTRAQISVIGNTDAIIVTTAAPTRRDLTDEIDLYAVAPRMLITYISLDEDIIVAEDE